MKKEVVIVGGGPAGMLMGLLLAKEGINVVVIEKNSSLERDFRGETIAPGSVFLLKKLGVFEDLEKHGFVKVDRIRMYDKESKLFTVDFDNFDHPQKFGIDMPQPEVLKAIKKQAEKYENFSYIAGATCNDLIIDQHGTIQGIYYKKGAEIHRIDSQLLIGAEGRFTRIRNLAGYEVQKEEFSRDLIWFKVPKPSDWEEANLIKVDKNDHVIILPTYPDFLRVGTYISSGGNRTTKKLGIDAFIDKVSSIEPRLRLPMQQNIKSWEDTSLLKIFTAHVDTWAKNGVILIGDAAHTLSPILGQGVNIAMQDAFELSPYIKNALLQSEGQPISSFHFDKYVLDRKKHISFVSKFQARQEQNLNASSTVACTLRKLKMMLLDKAPFKYTVMKKLQYGVFSNVKG